MNDAIQHAGFPEPSSQRGVKYGAGFECIPCGTISAPSVRGIDSGRIDVCEDPYE